MQRRPGGGVLTLVGPEQPATPPSAGVACSDQPGLLWAGPVLLGLPESAPRRSHAGWSTGTLGHCGALGRWGAQAIRRSKRAARVG